MKKYWSVCYSSHALIGYKKASITINAQLKPSELESNTFGKYVGSKIIIALQ